jgi:hypothetical protein
MSYYMMFVLFNSHTKDATSGAGTAYPAGEWSLIFSFLCSILLIFFCPDYDYLFLEAS